MLSSGLAEKPMNPSDEPMSDEAFDEKPMKPEPRGSDFLTDCFEEFGRKTRSDFPDRLRSSIFGLDADFSESAVLFVGSTTSGFGAGMLAVLQVH